MLIFQVQISLMVVLLSAALLGLLTKYADMLINLGAFLLLNDMGKIFGKFYVMYIDTFHEEITEDEQFLMF